MVKHIVMWKFKTGEEVAMQQFLEGLRSLYGKIDVLKKLEIGVSNPDSQYDAVLISEFDSFAGLEQYKNDPRHKAVSALCKKIRTDRVSIDYEF